MVSFFDPHTGHFSMMSAMTGIEVSAFFNSGIFGMYAFAFQCPRGVLRGADGHE
jgi:hypothetical protein